MKDKIFEVHVGTVKIKGIEKEVWQRTPFEKLSPGMIFRICNEPEFEGKLYKCTSMPMQPADGGQPYIQCDEVKPIHKPKYTL